MRFPEWLVPMAATLTQERFTGPAWIFERKYDGIRLLAFRKGANVRLLSRNQLPQYHPAIADVIGALPVNEIILDGEVDWGGSKVEYHVFEERDHQSNRHLRHRQPRKKRGARTPACRVRTLANTFKKASRSHE